jgi:hypothetical protein
MDRLLAQDVADGYAVPLPFRPVAAFDDDELEAS